MRGEIIKINSQILSRNGDGYVQTVIFKCEDKRVRELHIVSAYRNCARWTPLLKIGNVLDNLNLWPKDPDHNIDADSFPDLFVEKRRGKFIEVDGVMKFVEDKDDFVDWVNSKISDPALVQQKLI